MRSLSVALLACILVAVVADDSMVKIADGVLHGVVGKKSRSFLGIPFAAPPVNDLRWKAPQAPAPWSGVRNASWYGNSCMQSKNAFTLLTSISEDCLYLNVYTPYPVPTSPVPVMVFLYGGSWDTGSASFFLYNPDSDIALTEDVVFVTVNYRLNAFGFLASETLRSEASDQSVGNYGFQDQRFALEWVKANIGAFGGDANNVLLFGESAGAGSVSNHLLSPKSAGLFHRAIMESGPVADWTAQTFNTSVNKFNGLAHNVGCCSSASCSVDASVLSCLRTRNSSAIEGGTHGLTSGVLEWSPVIDGVNVVGDPQQLAKAGKIANVPILLGTNHDEGTLFTKAPKDLSVADYEGYLTGRYGQDLGEKVFNHYPASEFKAPFWACSTALGDSQMTCAARRTAEWVYTSRTDMADAAPVYVYFYNHTLAAVSSIVNKFRPLGCFHGSELVMVFDFEVALWTDDERSLAKAFVKYWTSFAKAGNPNTAGLPNWPAFDTTNRTTGVLDVGAILTPTPKLKADICDWWDVTPVPENLIWG